MAEDITPALLDEIQKQFNRDYGTDSKVQKLLDKINNGNANYDDVNAYAQKIGEILAKSFQDNLSSEVLPDGKMYFNIADRILRTTLGKNYDLVSIASEKVQSQLNKQAGIGLKAIKPVLDDDRIKGFVDRLDSEEDFDTVKWLLDEPVVNFTQKAVDDAIEQNAEFQYKTGLKPKIIRTLEPSERTCKWCEGLAGEYTYPNVPSEVFQRHDRCRCNVSYDGSNLRAYTGRGRRSQRSSNTFR